MRNIKLSNVTKTFSGKQVLKNILLEVPAGKVAALLGRNGAGKTTLMKILYGLLDPDTGEVEIGGYSSAKNIAELRLITGFMPEDCHLYPWMTALDLQYFLSPYYPTWDVDYFKNLTKNLEVPLDKAVGTMSRGTKRKLMLALTLAYKPKVLLLDEPFSGLDAVVREQILSVIIQTLADEGCTILISSHEINEIEKMCDRVIILNNGEINIDLDYEELKTKVRKIVAILESPVEIVPKHSSIVATKSCGAELQLLVKDCSDEMLNGILNNLKVKEYKSEAVSLHEIFINLVGNSED